MGVDANAACPATRSGDAIPLLQSILSKSASLSFLRLLIRTSLAKDTSPLKASGRGETEADYHCLAEDTESLDNEPGSASS